VKTAATEGVAFDHSWGPVKIVGREGKAAA